MAGFREIKSVFASLAAHSALLLLLFFGLSRSLHRERTPQPLLLEVSALSETQPSEKDAASIQSTSKKRAQKISAPHFQLKDLGVKYGWQMPTGKTSQLDSEPAPRGEEVQSNGLDLARDARDTPFFRFIYTKVNDNLFYPAELKAKMIQGAVNAVIVFTEGQFNEDQTRLSADSSYLKVTVMRALRKAFQEKLPERLYQLDARIEVSCRFIFQIVEHTDGETEVALNRVVGKNITFYRTFVHSVLQWRVGPLQGMGPSVGLDVKWIAEKVGDLFSKKAKIDPLDSYRDDPAW